MRIREGVVVGSMALALLSSIVGPFTDPVLQMQRMGPSPDPQELRGLAQRAADRLPPGAAELAAQSLPSPLARTLLLSAVVERSAARSPEAAARLAALIPSSQDRCAAWLTCFVNKPGHDEWIEQALSAARSCSLAAQRGYWLDRIADAVAPSHPLLAAALRDEATRASRGLAS